MCGKESVMQAMRGYSKETSPGSDSEPTATPGASPLCAPDGGGAVRNEEDGGECKGTAGGGSEQPEATLSRSRATGGAKQSSSESVTVQQGSECHGRLEVCATLAAKKGPSSHSTPRSQPECSPHRPSTDVDDTPEAVQSEGNKGRGKRKPGTGCIRYRSQRWHAQFGKQGTKSLRRVCKTREEAEAWLKRVAEQARSRSAASPADTKRPRLIIPLHEPLQEGAELSEGTQRSAGDFGCKEGQGGGVAAVPEAMDAATHTVSRVLQAMLCRVSQGAAPTASESHTGACANGGTATQGSGAAELRVASAASAGGDPGSGKWSDGSGAIGQGEKQAAVQGGGGQRGAPLLDTEAAAPCGGDGGAKAEGRSFSGLRITATGCDDPATQRLRQWTAECPVLIPRTDRSHSRITAASIISCFASPAATEPGAVAPELRMEGHFISAVALQEDGRSLRPLTGPHVLTMLVEGSLRCVAAVVRLSHCEPRTPQAGDVLLEYTDSTTPAPQGGVPRCSIDSVIEGRWGGSHGPSASATTSNGGSLGTLKDGVALPLLLPRAPTEGVTSEEIFQWTGGKRKAGGARGSSQCTSCDTIAIGAGGSATPRHLCESVEEGARGLRDVVHSVTDDAPWRLRKTPQLQEGKAADQAHALSRPSPSNGSAFDRTCSLAHFLPCKLAKQVTNHLTAASMQSSPPASLEHALSALKTAAAATHSQPPTRSGGQQAAVDPAGDLSDHHRSPVSLASMWMQAVAQRGSGRGDSVEVKAELRERVGAEDVVADKRGRGEAEWVQRASAEAAALREELIAERGVSELRRMQLEELRASVCMQASESEREREGVGALLREFVVVVMRGELQRKELQRQLQEAHAELQREAMDVHAVSHMCDALQAVGR